MTPSLCPSFWCSRCVKDHPGECPPPAAGPVKVSVTVDPDSANPAKLAVAQIHAAVSAAAYVVQAKASRDWSGHVPAYALPAVYAPNQVPWAVGDVVASKTPQHDGMVFLVLTVASPGGYHDCQLLAGIWQGQQAQNRGRIGRDSYYGQHSVVVG